MKKLTFILGMFILLVGCQKKDDKKLLADFVDGFYQVSVSEIEAYTDFITEHQDLKPTDLPQWIKVTQLFSDRYKEQYLRERAYIPIIDFKKTYSVKKIDVKDHTFEVDFEDDDFIYYLHTSTLVITYEKDHLIDNYRISDPIEYQ